MWWWFVSSAKTNEFTLYMVSFYLVMSLPKNVEFSQKNAETLLHHPSVSLSSQRPSVELPIKSSIGKLITVPLCSDILCFPMYLTAIWNRRLFSKERAYNIIWRYSERVRLSTEIWVIQASLASVQNGINCPSAICPVIISKQLPLSTFCLSLWLAIST